MTADPFSAFRPENANTEQQIQKPVQIKREQREAGLDPFAMMRPPEFEEESSEQKMRRQATQYGSRGLERVGGFMGDIHNFLGDLVISSYENAGLTGFIPEKRRDAPEWLKRAVGKSEYSQKQFPTSGDLRNISEGISGGFTAPRSKDEEYVGNVVGDVVSTFLPGTTAKKSIYNNLLVPLGANLVEKGIEQYSDDPRASTYGKIGSWFVLGNMANANAKKYAGQLRQQAESMLPQNAPYNPQTALNNLTPVVQKYLSNAPTQKAAQGQVMGIVKDIQNGKTSIQDLMQRITQINSEIDSGGGFEIPQAAKKNVRRDSIRNLNDVKSKIYETIEQETQNIPGFFEKYKDSQDAFAGIAKSNRFLDFAKHHYGKFASAGLAALLGGSYLGHPIYSLAAVPSLFALHKAGQVLYRISTNKTLSKHYREAMQAASIGNAPAYIQNISMLDEELADREKKKKKN